LKAVPSEPDLQPRKNETLVFVLYFAVHYIACAAIHSGDSLRIEAYETVSVGYCFHEKAAALEIICKVLGDHLGIRSQATIHFHQGTQKLNDCVIKSTIKVLQLLYPERTFPQLTRETIHPDWSPLEDHPLPAFAKPKKKPTKDVEEEEEEEEVEKPQKEGPLPAPILTGRTVAEDTKKSLNLLMRNMFMSWPEEWLDSMMWKDLKERPKKHLNLPKTKSPTTEQETALYDAWEQLQSERKKKVKQVTFNVKEVKK